MSTDAQIAANRINAQASTGPTSAAGQARVSRNALSSGLYSRGDFVRPDEQDIYAQFCVGFWTDLAPEGAIEQTLSAEIIHAAWRLRRCSVIEAGMVFSDSAEPDPLLDRTQLSVDRAHAQAHRIFHRTTAELRRFQTERRFRTEFLDEEFDTSVLGLASYKDMAPLLTKMQAVNKMQASSKSRKPVPTVPEPVFTKQSQAADDLLVSIGLNSPCKCGSGIKFKRCCGKDVPAFLHNAA